MVGSGDKLKNSVHGFGDISHNMEINEKEECHYKRTYLLKDTQSHFSFRKKEDKAYSKRKESISKFHSTVLLSGSVPPASYQIDS